MGGNALKTHTRRYQTDEFKELQSEFHEFLSKELGYTYAYPLRWYRNKESHGDMDILVMTNNIPDDKLWNMLKNNFPEVYTNANVYSIPYKELQVDLILTKPEHWSVSAAYFDYDPSGNLMGKLAHKFGLKYGHAGLLYPIRVGTKLYDIHQVSLDNHKIFEFLGYNYDEFINGFDEIEEIYDYIINGAYFNVDIFKLENLTQIDRKRNRKRPTYNTFLSYVNDKEIRGGYEFNKDKESYIESIDSFFQCGLVEAIEIIKAHHRLLEQVHDKWNGDIIMRHFPHLSGQRLGEAIGRFKSMFYDDEAYNQYIVNTGLVDIIRNFRIIA